MPKHEAATILSAGAAVSAVAGAYKFAEFVNRAKRLHDVGPANAVFVRQIQRVRRDLDEVQRLLTVPEVKEALRTNPPKAKWVYGSLKDTRVALEEIIPLTERVQGDLEGGRHVGWRHRLRWLLHEKEKLQNRELELNTVHASLCEVLGWLTSLEPVDEHEHGRGSKHEIDMHHREPRQEGREVWAEEHERGPRRVDEREVYIEREHGPRRVEEREAWVERGPDGHAEGRFVERDSRRHEEHELRVHQDPRHMEAEYYERRPGGHIEAEYHEHRPGGHMEEQRYAQDRFEERRHGPQRRHSDEDVVRERESFMESSSRRVGGPVDYYEYERRVGDAGFGDEIVTNPQPVPPLNRQYEREVWIEEKEDYRYDQYGNRLPDRMFPKRYPRSRM